MKGAVTAGADVQDPMTAHRLCRRSAVGVRLSGFNTPETSVSSQRPFEEHQ
jgi:hypothetical protein